MKGQAQDWQRECELARRQVEMERRRAAELEHVVASERRQLHESQVEAAGVLRENDDLKLEVDRLQMRVESMQGRIDTFGRY